MISPADAAPGLDPISRCSTAGRGARSHGHEDLAHDPLRGLYISDDQALSLASGRGADAADARLARAPSSRPRRVGQRGACVCTAPELHPRYGRLYAYLQDDMTRRLASPRLVADLLADQGISEPPCWPALPLRLGFRAWARSDAERGPAMAFADRAEGRRPAGSVRARARAVCGGLRGNPPAARRSATGGCGREEAVSRSRGCWPRERDCRSAVRTRRRRDPVRRGAGPAGAARRARAGAARRDRRRAARRRRWPRRCAAWTGSRT